MTNIHLSHLRARLWQWIAGRRHARDSLVALAPEAARAIAADIGMPLSTHPTGRPRETERSVLLDGMVRAHGVKRSMIDRAPPVTRRYLEQNCAVCPHTRACAFHQRQHVAEEYAKRYCGNADVLVALQDEYGIRTSLLFPRHFRARDAMVGRAGLTRAPGCL